MRNKKMIKRIAAIVYAGLLVVTSMDMHSIESAIEWFSSEETLERLQEKRIIEAEAALTGYVAGTNGSVSGATALVSSSGGIPGEVLSDPGMMIGIYRAESSSVAKNGLQKSLDSISRGNPLHQQLIKPIYVYTSAVENKLKNPQGGLNLARHGGDSVVVKESVDNRIVIRGGGSNPGTNGVYYESLKVKSKEELLKWRDIAATKTGTSVSTWDYILGKTNYGPAKKIISIFKIPGQDGNVSASSQDDAEGWLRYLDFLMTLHEYAKGTGSQTAWGAAIDDYVNNRNLVEKPVNVALMPATIVRSSAGTFAVAWHDYLNILHGVSNKYSPNKESWHATIAPTIGGGALFNNMYGQQKLAVDKSIQDKNVTSRIADSYNAKNPWSFGSYTITSKTLKTTKSGSSWVAYNSGNTNFVAEMVWLNKAGVSAKQYGQNIIFMPAAAQESELGKLVATPKEQPIQTKTIGMPVTLQVYSGANTESRKQWETIIADSKANGTDIKIVIEDMKRASTQVTGEGTYVPGIPYEEVMTPEEFKSWLNEEKAITFTDDNVADHSTEGLSKIKIDYECKITIYYGEGFKKSQPNRQKNPDTGGKVIKDYASFVVNAIEQKERIRYTSKPEAYAEIKNYDSKSGSNMTGTLSEKWEAMAGVPSTEQLYFAAGGSEFIVDVTLEYTENELAWRSYNPYYTAVDCEFKGPDNANNSPRQIKEHTVNLHGGGTYTHTWTGSIPNLATPVTATHSATCPGVPDRTDYNAKKAEAQAYVAAVNATTLQHTSGSDKATRVQTGWSAHISTDNPVDPQTTSASVGCSASKYTPCGNEQATASPAGPGNFTIIVTFTVPAHILCGPCCEHILPEIHDTWRQSFEYDTVKILDVHVQEINQAAVNGMSEIIGAENDVVNAQIIKGHPSLFYNVGMKNMKELGEDPSNDYLKNTNNKNRVETDDKATYQSEVGRIRYSLNPEKHDTAEYALGVRTNKCDGLAYTFPNSKIQAGGKGHDEVWATGFIYDTYKEASTNYGQFKGKQAGNKTYPENEVGWLQANTDGKDKATTEYNKILSIRQSPNTATMITDFLILQTSSGSQSVMYFDKNATTVTAETEIPKQKTSKQEMWDNNANSASKWKADHINIGGYNGYFNTPSTKFKWNTKGNAPKTVFDTKDPAAGGYSDRYTIVRPTEPTTNLMLYQGELNIILGNINQSYDTGRAEVYWQNLLHFTDIVNTGLAPDPMQSIFEDKATIGEETQFDFSAATKVNNDESNARYTKLHPNAMKLSGSTLHAPYSRSTNKVNDLIIQDPVSTENANLISLPQERDQRTTKVGGASDLLNGLNKATVCPLDPGLCDFRVLKGEDNNSCDYFKDTELLIMSFDTEASIVNTDSIEVVKTRDTNGNIETTDLISGEIDGEYEVITRDADYNIIKVETKVFNSKSKVTNAIQNEVTNNVMSLDSLSGIKLVSGVPGMSGNALHFDGSSPRLQIPFTELGLTYSSSTRLSVSADAILKKDINNDQMLFSFYQYDAYIPHGKGNIVLNTGNAEELVATVPGIDVTDGNKHSIEVIFDFSNVEEYTKFLEGVGGQQIELKGTGCEVYVDGIKATMTRVNISKDITRTLLGSNFNIGSWGKNDNYPLRDAYIDNLKIVKLAGSTQHNDDCYTIRMMHPNGLNNHKHSQACLNGQGGKGFQDFGYTGGVQTFTAPYDGMYTLEAWGASGGEGYSAGRTGLIGKGGYTKGQVRLKKGQVIYVYTGQQGGNYTKTNYSFNGGGGAFLYSAVAHSGGQGGGATDFRLTNGTWDNLSGLQSRILVAGGGGSYGCASNHNPGHGGGLQGVATLNPAGGGYAGASASGGSQKAGGTGVGAYKGTASGSGSFGKGANGVQCAAGGGGGYYGGGSEYTAGGAGGSSFVTGYSGCDSTYRYLHKNLEFTGVKMEQGVNSGNGKARISWGGLDWFIDGFTNGTITDQEAKDMLGDAYKPIMDNALGPVIHTWENWTTANPQGFKADYNTLAFTGNNLVSTIRNPGFEFSVPVDIPNAGSISAIRVYLNNNTAGNSFGVYKNGASSGRIGAYMAPNTSNQVITLRTDSWSGAINSLNFDTSTGQTTGSTTITKIELLGFGQGSYVNNLNKWRTYGNGTLTWDVAEQAFKAVGHVQMYLKPEFAYKIDRNKTYKIVVTAKVSNYADQRFYWGGDRLDANKQHLQGYGGTYDYSVASSVATGNMGWKTYEATKSGSAATAAGWGTDTVYFSLGGLLNYNGTSNQVTWVKDIALIEDGVVVQSLGGGVDYGSTGKVYWQSGTPGTYAQTLPQGEYKLEVWGAQGGVDTWNGGNYRVGGLGGYSSGIVNIGNPTNYYISVGGQGASTLTASSGNAGYNGGGSSSGHGSGGGGATHIATVNGLLGALSSNRGSILIVAGGGGGIDYGGSWLKPTGDGGGTDGGMPRGKNLGATQNSGYVFGVGQPIDGSLQSGAGGGGYYGGYVGISEDQGTGRGSWGGGGSGYVNTAVLKSAKTIAGNASQTSPSGGTQVGQTGNGYAKITQLSTFIPLKITGGGTGEFESGDKKDFPYTGSVQSITLGEGQYKLEVWGAQGYTQGGYQGGKGGYSTAILDVKDEQKAYIYTGGQGNGKAGGFNGGGNGNYGGGGGATHIAGVSGTLRELASKTWGFLIVAGGGGGSAHVGNGGAGGGISGLPGTSASGSYGAGGTATGAGYGGGFGYGGTDVRHGGGGGGGYYGGGGGGNDCEDGGGGGSSNYSNGLTSASTLAGNATQTAPNGTSQTGQSGNGYARITALYVKPAIRLDKQDILNHWELIPDLLPDGNDNPIWGCDRKPNEHICDNTCGEVKVLNCTEPHHKGGHYDPSNSMCWEACGDDSLHKKHADEIADVNVGDGSFTPGNFVNIDWPFEVYFPNIGNFNQGQPYGIETLTDIRGKGFTNGLDTTRWTKKKRIKFNINVIYKDELYNAGEWITLSDYGEFMGADGGIGSKGIDTNPDDGYYQEKKWSNFGKVIFDDVNGNLMDSNGYIINDDSGGSEGFSGRNSDNTPIVIDKEIDGREVFSTKLIPDGKTRNNIYRFYAVLANSEVRASEVTVDVEAVNAMYGNDNIYEETNKFRSKGFNALHGGTRVFYMDLVGRIGNLTMQDTTDYRFSNFFKTPIEAPATLEKTVYDISNLGTDGNTTVDGTSLSLNELSSSVYFEDVLQEGEYRIDISGKKLGNGRLGVTSRGNWINTHEFVSDSKEITYENDIAENKFTLTGPKVSLTPGKYRMTINGEGFTDADFKIYEGLGLDGQRDLVLESEEKEESTLVYYFDLLDNTPSIGIDVDFAHCANEFSFESMLIDKLDTSTDVDLVARGYITKILETSTLMAYYITIPANSEVKVEWISNNDKGLSVANMTLTHLGKNSSSWIIDNIVKKVDEGLQNNYQAWKKDIRDIGITNRTRYLDTYQTRQWMVDLGKDPVRLPLSPGINNIDILKDEPMLPGYNALMDITTLGNYYADNASMLQITPYYYALDIKNDTLTPVDIYLKLDSGYEPINLFANYHPNNSDYRSLKIYKYVMNLDWINESLRRGYTALEQMQTDYFRTALASGGSPLTGGFDENEYFGPGGVDAKPYKQLDAPVGSFYTLGNGQVMHLSGKARTFIGGEMTYNTLRNLGGANKTETDAVNDRVYNKEGKIQDNEWWLGAQRWHFTMGLPSSAVFIRHTDGDIAAGEDSSFDPDREVTIEMTEEFKGSNYLILMTADIKAVGDTYILDYAEHRKQGDNGYVEIRLKSDGKSIKQYTLPTDIPTAIAVYSSELATDYDVKITKTH